MEIVGAEISLINSVLVRIKCLQSVDSVKDVLIPRSVKMLKLKLKFWMKRNISCVLQFLVVLIILQVLVVTTSLEFNHGGKTTTK